MSGLMAYYRPLEPVREGYESFDSTAGTVSVWAPNMQHGAPPSALLTRALERCDPRAETALARITIDLLGPVPVSRVHIRAWIERPGTRVTLVKAEMTAAHPSGSDRVVATASGWMIATSDTRDVVHVADSRLFPDPQASAPSSPFPPHWRGGYLDTLEFRGSSVGGGSGAQWIWARRQVPVVEGESASALVNLMSVADIANGVGAQIDPAHWTFLNTELTVHIARRPVGEWVGVRSETTTGPDGIGFCAGTVHDVHGPVGRTGQAVEIRRRSRHPRV